MWMGIREQERRIAIHFKDWARGSRLVAKTSPGDGSCVHGLDNALLQDKKKSSFYRGDRSQEEPAHRGPQPPGTELEK